LRSFDYEPGEDVFDEEPEEQEALEGEDGVEGETYPTANGDNVVVSGDPNAGYAGKVMEQSREKKVPNDQRTTTPYLTKYERARVLGTRALQIRYVLLAKPMIADMVH
jgi:DNA-directed RNA polymerase I, II, and III subunit RPABC2